MKKVKKLELKKRTIETLGKPEMSIMRGGGTKQVQPTTITGTTCFNTPAPTSEYLSCA